MRPLAGLVLATSVATSLAACAATPPRTERGEPVAALVVRPVDWNSTHAPLAPVRAVADARGTTVVVTDAEASVFSAGALVGTERRPHGWAAAAVIPAADRGSPWIVALDGDGRVERLRNQATFEDVSPRYGLDGVPLRAAAPLGGASVAFVWDGGLAVADGRAVTRYPIPGVTDLAGGAGVAVAVGLRGLEVVRPATGTVVTIPAPGVVGAAVAGDGRLFAATADALYAGSVDAGLTLLYRPLHGAIHGLAASGARVWFADGHELGAVEGDHVSETVGTHLGSRARLVPASGGDVWVIDGGQLLRFQVATASPTAQAEWSSTVAPVFARACSACHLATGRAGLDLSTAAAWDVERKTIIDRVLVERTMPPKGHVLTDADRATLDAWSRGAR